MGGDRAGSGHRRAGGGERSERGAYWIALAIALFPIPAALLISWALGDPPWRARPAPTDHGGANEARVGHGPR